MRIRFITAGILVLGLLLTGRLYQVQVMASDHYQARAQEQYVHTTQDLYSRGSILFTTKHGEQVSAASIRSGYVLAVNPERVQAAAESCATIAAYISLSSEACTDRATRPARTYVELDTKVSDAAAEAIEALDLPGFMLYRTQWRYYPGKSMAARSIGFVGYTESSGSQLHGKYGLERYYDQVLYRDRSARSVDFFAEIFSNLGEFVYDRADERQGDIVTTLEPTVSRMLDGVLEATNERYESDLTGAIIMDPDTGAIYALNAVPSFDLNDRTDATIEQFQNPLVENVYEFGSTFKPLTIAAGLDSGAITPSSTYYDGGSIELDTFTIRNYDGRGRGTVDMQEVLNQSLNTGVAHIVQQMGKERFRDYFLDFKLGSETGIDLPYEVHGLVENLRSPRDVEYATASFGQGIAVTPIAAARAFATLGNGGHLVTPHLVSRIEYADGSHRVVQYPDGDQVLSPETSEEISRMLTNVVDDALLGGQVALSHHTIGAKTGTAQIPDPEQGGYYEDRYLHSFFGYAPAYDPEFLVFMYTVDPKGVRYASETLTEPFMEITRFLLNYYSIPPDR